MSPTTIRGGSEGGSAVDFDSAFGRLRDEVDIGCRRGGGWPENAAEAVRAAFAFAEREPDSAHLLTVEVLLDRDDGPGRYLRLLDVFTERLREVAPVRPGAPPITEQFLVGAIVNIVRTEASLGRRDAIADLAPDAVQFLLAPYLGAPEAHRIAVAAPR